MVKLECIFQQVKLRSIWFQINNNFSYSVNKMSRLFDYVWLKWTINKKENILDFIVYHYITPLYILLTSLYLVPPAWKNPGSVQLDTPKITVLAVVTQFMVMNLQWALSTALCISLVGLLSHTLKLLHCTSFPKYPTPLPFLTLSWKLYFSFHWEK